MQFKVALVDDDGNQVSEWEYVKPIKIYKAYPPGTFRYECQVYMDYSKGVAKNATPIEAEEVKRGDEMSGNIMTFPKTWYEYEEYYGFYDTEYVYTNGSKLIQTFRVRQWLDHVACNQTLELLRRVKEQCEHGEGCDKCWYHQFCTLLPEEWEF